MATLKENMDAIKAVKDSVIKPENIKQGIKIFDVEGSFQGASTGDVKLFATKEDMDNDSTAKQDDLAILYDTSLTEINISSNFNMIEFDDIVTLDTLITSTLSGYWTGGASRLQAMITASVARFTNYKDYSRVQYTSTDGITYTRTDTLGNPIIFDDMISFDTNYYEFNTIFSKFIKSASNNFQGLYKFKEDYVDKNVIKFPSLTGTTITYNGSAVNATFDGTYLATYDYSKLIHFRDILKQRGFINSPGTQANIVYFLNLNNELCFAKQGTYSVDICLALNGSTGALLGITLGGTSTTPINIYKVTSLEDVTYELITTITPNKAIGNYKYASYTDISSMFLSLAGTSQVVRGAYMTYNSSYYWASDTQINAGAHYQLNEIKDIYLPAPTQLNVDNVNQIMEGKTALGSDKAYTGDISIYRDIDVIKTIQAKSAIEPYTKGTYIYTNIKNDLGIVSIDSSNTEHFHNGVCTFKRKLSPIGKRFNSYTENYYYTVAYNENKSKIIATIYDSSFNKVYDFEFDAIYNDGSSPSLYTAEGGNYLYLLVNEHGATTDYNGPNYLNFIKFDITNQTFTRKNIDFPAGCSITHMDCDEQNSYILAYNGHYYDDEDNKANIFYKDLVEVKRINYGGAYNIIDNVELIVAPDYVYVFPNALYDYGTYKMGIYNKSTQTFSTPSVSVTFEHGDHITFIRELDDNGIFTGNINYCINSNRYLYKVTSSGLSRNGTLPSYIKLETYGGDMYQHNYNNTVEYITVAGDYYNSEGELCSAWKDQTSFVILEKNFFMVNRNGKFTITTTQVDYVDLYELRFDLKFEENTDNFLIDCKDEENMFLLVHNDLIIN